MKLRAFINYFLYFCMKITVYLHELTIITTVRADNTKIIR